MRISTVHLGAAFLMAAFLMASPVLTSPAAAATGKAPVASPLAAPMADDGIDDDGGMMMAPPTAVARPAMPDRIERPMIALDPMTLKAEGIEIRLWGIRSAQSSAMPLELKAMDLLDQLIAGQVVNCKIAGGTIPVLQGRCIGQGNQDLALALLNEGLAVRDRRMTYNTPYASAYGQAEEFARINKRGVWSFLVEGGDKPAADGGGFPFSKWTLLLILGLGPMFGLMLIAIVMSVWMQKLARAQRTDVERTQKKEAMLQSRERSVLLSTLEGELLENKNKIEAFLTIHGDILRGLKDPGGVPKYQQVGDIVQKHPNFSKVVFEANVNKLSLLGIKLAGHISKLYAALPKDQEYINLEPSVPLETAVKLVEKVIDEAKELLPPVNQILAELQAVTEKQEGRE